jgi:hypothetical protein
MSFPLIHTHDGDDWSKEVQPLITLDFIKKFRALGEGDMVPPELLHLRHKDAHDPLLVLQACTGFMNTFQITEFICKPWLTPKTWECVIGNNGPVLRGEVQTIWTKEFYDAHTGSLRGVNTEGGIIICEETPSEEIRNEDEPKWLDPNTVVMPNGEIRIGEDAFTELKKAARSGKIKIIPADGEELGSSGDQRPSSPDIIICEEPLYEAAYWELFWKEYHERDKSKDQWVNISTPHDQPDFEKLMATLGEGIDEKDLNEARRRAAWQAQSALLNPEKPEETKWN